MFRKAGFSLVEVLVSIVVLALGVIGAAGMQLTALRTTQQTAFQTHALQLAAEMAEAVMASERQIDSSEGTNPFLDLNYQSAHDSAPAVPDKLCYEIGCDGKEFAEFETYEWKNRIRTALPGGRVLICRDSAPWNKNEHALSWDCSGSANDALVIKLGWQARNPDGSLSRDGRNESVPRVVIPVNGRAK